MACVHTHQPVDLASLPLLSEGFNIQLDTKEWAAFFPRHHVMWVSSDFKRTRSFLKSANERPGGYESFLSEPMKKSFGSYYSFRTSESTARPNVVPKGEILDSTICFLATNDCNLGCKYCFSGAEPKKFGSIPWEIAKAAIDLGVRNAILSRMRFGVGELSVNFYGGGEPTEYWDRFAEIVEYARATADRNGIGVGVSTITNGQIGEEHWKWFKSNIDEVSVSMDGPRDIHDSQRPTFSGESSFEKSWKFLSAMDALKMQIAAIRITVTAQTVFRMREIADFFWDSLPTAHPLQFEPVYFSEVGRQNTDMPKALDFVSQFKAVEELARDRESAGKPFGRLGTASRPLAIRAGAYCDSLEGKGLFITPNGYLSLCSEVSTPNDPRRDDYFVGGYNASTKRFHVLEDARSKIRCGPPWWCRGCFAQYSCAGGCEPRSQSSDKNVRKWWCQMVRANLRGTWSDVKTNKIQPRSRIGGPNAEELIWLPVWEESASMEA